MAKTPRFKREPVDLRELEIAKQSFEVLKQFLQDIGEEEKKAKGEILSSSKAEGQH